MPSPKLKDFARVCALIAAVPRAADSFEKMQLEELQTLEVDLQDAIKFENCLKLLRGIARPRRRHVQASGAPTARAG